MKILKSIILITTLFLFCSCEKDVAPNDIILEKGDPTSIEIADYIFHFQTNFKLEELWGFDSEVGNVNGYGFSLFYDYGWYTKPSENLPANEYIVLEDEIKGYYRQIVIPIDSENNYTKIHMYKKSELNAPPGYNSITMSAIQLNSAEQAIVVDVFQNVELK